MPIGGAGDASDFYPRPPRGGRRVMGYITIFTERISIHALREEGDETFSGGLSEPFDISIHALREEGDLLL